MSATNSTASPNWKTPILLVGGVLGAIVGVVAAHLYIRAGEEALERARQRGPQGLKLSPGTMLPIVMGVVSLLRQINGLANASDRK